MSILNIQFVFAVKYRAAQIDIAWKEQLHQNIADIIRKNKHKILEMNAMPDHLHVFIGMGPAQSVDALAERIMTQSSKWIEEQQFCAFPFSWQEGYCALSYSERDIPDVILNIQNQETHHQHESFLDEYKKLLTLYDIEWEEQDIFKELE
jgi:putative transposase